MDRSVRGADSVVPVLRSFAVRGVVEGFYGTPWTHDARLEVISFLAARGMNAYAYAPKDDARHRAEWRVPYDGPDLARFGELAAHGAGSACGSASRSRPGSTSTTSRRPTATRCCASWSRCAERACRGSCSCSTTSRCSPASRRARPRSSRGCIRPSTAPRSRCARPNTSGRPSLAVPLGARRGMPPEVDVMWTGPTVCSPELRADDARGWTKALGDRRVIVWDNYPVNDALMTASLHLGPYQGRDADLADVVGGSPLQPDDPGARVADRARDRDGLPRRPRRLRRRRVVVARDLRRRRRPRDTAGRPGPCMRRQPDRGARHARSRAPRRRARAGARRARLGRCRGRGAETSCAAARSTTDAFPDPADPADPLAAEIGPWAAALRRAADAGLAALRLIQAVRPVACRSRGAGSRCGRAAAPDPEPAMHSAFMVLYVWKGARTDERVVFGPRFAIYTPVIQMPDGAPALDARAALREDANAIDGLCRLALRTYDDWRTAAAGTRCRSSSTAKNARSRATAPSTRGPNDHRAPGARLDTHHGRAPRSPSPTDASHDRAPRLGRDAGLQRGRDPRHVRQERRRRLACPG